MTDHWQTMSLTSGTGTLPKENHRVFSEKRTNDISDIDGARSAVRYRVYEGKPQFLDTSDISGSQPKQLIHGRNTRDNSLYVDDIDGTRRMVKDRMMRTGRHVDPLNPNYNLPAFHATETISNKFVKDQMTIDDIEGTRPKPKKVYDTRDIMSVNDIDGAKPGLTSTRRVTECATRDHINFSDVSAKNRYIDRTHRVTDPANPQYSINGLEIRDDKYTKPRPGRDYVPGFNLETKDIKGALAGSRYESPFPRREYRNTNFIGDIQGSHADTIRPGITTMRQCNPLQPVYQSLDPGEMLLPVIAPLVPAEMVKVPTLPSMHSKHPPAQQSTQTLSRPRTDPDLANTFGNTNNSFSETNFSFTADMNNVQFTSSFAPETHSGKPPRPATLDLPISNNNNNNYSNNNNTFSFGYAGGNQANGNSSGPNSHRSVPRSQATAGNVINLGSSSGAAGGGNRSTGASPMVSARAPATPSMLMAQKKAANARQAEIDSVRQLSW